MKGYIGVKRVVDGKANDIPTVIHRQFVDDGHNAVGVIVVVEHDVVVKDQEPRLGGHFYRELGIRLDGVVVVAAST